MIALFYQATIIISILAAFSIGLFLINNYTLSKILGSITSLFWFYWTLGGSVYFVDVKIRTFSKLWNYQIIEAIAVFIVCYAIINNL